MHGVLSAPLAMFFQFYFSVNRLSILVLVVIQTLTGATPQFYKIIAEFSLCHRYYVVRYKNTTHKEKSKECVIIK